MSFDMEPIKDHLRWNKKAIIWGSFLVLCFVTLFFCDWSGATGWFMFPLIGTIVSTVFTGIGIYDGNVQRVANKFVQEDRAPTHKSTLKAMYKEREKLAKEIYSYRDRPNLIEADIRSMKRLDKKIAIHRGLLPEE